MAAAILMTRGRSLIEHLNQIDIWARDGIIDEEIAIRLGANYESVGRVRRAHHIPNGREVLLARDPSRVAPRVSHLVPVRKDPEKEWTSLLKGRRFNEPGMMVR